MLRFHGLHNQIKTNIEMIFHQPSHYRFDLQLKKIDTISEQ